MTNVLRPDFDQPREDREGFKARRAFLGRQAGAERLGISLWAIEPGEAAYPYHFHYAEEEAVVVLEGEPAVRTPDGWRDVEEGELIVFPRGERGGHQIVNRSEAPVRFLSISTAGEPEICVYPDSGKIGAFERLPGGGELYELYRREDQVGYWEGEEPPPLVA